VATGIQEEDASQNTVLPAITNDTGQRGTEMFAADYQTTQEKTPLVLNTEAVGGSQSRKSV